MAIFLLGLILLGLIILAAPVSLGYNSLENRFKVRWLGLTFTRMLGREKPEKPKKPKKTPKRKTAASKARGLGAMKVILRQRDLVRELIRKILGFVLEVGRTLTFRDSEAAISLPDPALNGMLHAVVSNINLPKMNLSVNFEQRNYAKIWVRVYPYRVFQKLAVFLFHFPFIKTIRLAWALKKHL